jgi:hypothetical protein
MGVRNASDGLIFQKSGRFIGDLEGIKEAVSTCLLVQYW